MVPENILFDLNTRFLNVEAKCFLPLLNNLNVPKTSMVELENIHVAYTQIFILTGEIRKIHFSF